MTKKSKFELACEELSMWAVCPHDQYHCSCEDNVICPKHKKDDNFKDLEMVKRSKLEFEYCRDCWREIIEDEYNESKRL